MRASDTDSLDDDIAGPVGETDLALSIEDNEPLPSHSNQRLFAEAMSNLSRKACEELGQSCSQRGLVFRVSQ